MQTATGIIDADAAQAQPKRLILHAYIASSDNLYNIRLIAADLMTGKPGAAEALGRELEDIRSRPL